jgi:hypothetical protein
MGPPGPSDRRRLLAGRGVTSRHRTPGSLSSGVPWFPARPSAYVKSTLGPGTGHSSAQRTRWHLPRVAPDFEPGSRPSSVSEPASSVTPSGGICGMYVARRWHDTRVLSRRLYRSPSGWSRAAFSRASSLCVSYPRMLAPAPADVPVVPAGCCLFHKQRRGRDRASRRSRVIETARARSSSKSCCSSATGGQGRRWSYASLSDCPRTGTPLRPQMAGRRHDPARRRPDASRARFPSGVLVLVDAPRRFRTTDARSPRQEGDEGDEKDS